MSESAASVLIAAGILILLALFIPCMESLVNLLRRDAQKQEANALKESEEISKRRVA